MSFQTLFGKKWLKAKFLILKYLSTGLIFFLFLLKFDNNLFLFSGNKFPFIMKLCFSSSRSMTIKNGDNNSNGPGDKQDH